MKNITLRNRTAVQTKVAAELLSPTKVTKSTIVFENVEPADLIMKIDALVKEHGPRSAAAKSLMPIARAIAKADEATPADPEPVLIEVVDDATKEQRRQAARAEDKKLAAWKKAGEVGPRPATPNVDAVVADATRKPTKKATAKSSTSKPKVERSKRHQAMIDARRERKFAKGDRRKMTDAELAKYVAKVRRAHPDSPKETEREYAYWVEGIALSVRRFDVAWEAFDAPAAA